MSSEGTETCSHAPAASDTAAAGRQIYSCTVIRSSKRDPLTCRTGELAQPAKQPAHQNLLVEPPLAASRAPAHTVRTYGITARIPSLEVDPPAIGSYGPQKHTFLKSTPFPEFPKKHWLSNSHFEGDCVKVLTIQLTGAHSIERRRICSSSRSSVTARDIATIRDRKSRRWRPE